ALQCIPRIARTAHRRISPPRTLLPPLDSCAAGRQPIPPPAPPVLAPDPPPAPSRDRQRARSRPSDLHCAPSATGAVARSAPDRRSTPLAHALDMRCPCLTGTV